MQSPFPSVGSIKGEGVINEIKMSIHGVFRKCFSMLGDSGDWGQPVDFKQGSSQRTQAFMQPSDFVVHQTEKITSKEVVGGHVLLWTHLNTSGSGVP